MFNHSFWTIARSVLLFGTTLAVLYMVPYEAWPGQLSTKIFWGAVLIAALLLPDQSRPSALLSLVLMVAAAGLAATTFDAYFRQEQIMVLGPTDWDVFAGTFGLVLTIYCTWRWSARPLAILAALFIGFALFGSYLPVGFGHSPIDIAMLVNHLFIGSEGMFGIALNTILHIVFVFIVLTALLEASGGSNAIVALSMKIFRKSTGAPGKVSVVASALFGMMTGAAVANVIASGSITIPLMKKSGYKPAEAAAIESVASTGSQIMPPVLGSAGFIMAELLQVPFTHILAAAALPALFYYTTLFAGVHAARRAHGIDHAALAEHSVLGGIRRIWLLTPILVLLVCLLWIGFTPAFSAFFAIVSVPVAAYLATGKFMSIRVLADAAVRAANMMVPIGLLGASAGIIIGVFSLTGLGQKLVNAVLFLSGGNIFLVLIVTMVSSIVLGMGLPTVAVYIILALTVAPAMIQADVPPLVAHFFVFYYGVLAAITPPVALATIAAASVANCSIWDAGWRAMRLAIVPYTLPFLFVLQPGLLGLGGSAALIEAVFVTGSFSVFAVLAATGFLFIEAGRPHRYIFAALAAAVLAPALQWWVIGAGWIIFASIFVRQRKLA